MHLHVRNVNAAFAKIVRGFHDGSIKTEKTTSRNGVVMVHEEPFTLSYEKPLERVLFNQVRDANPFFHLYESLWLLAGHNDVAPLTYYNSRIPEFSDDGKTLNDSYGYRWRHATRYRPDDTYAVSRSEDVDQLDIIVDHLRNKPESRRAVLQMWNVEDDLLKIDGVPCAVCIEQNKCMFFTDPGPCKQCGSPHKRVGTVPSKAVCCNTHAYFLVDDGPCTLCDGKGSSAKSHVCPSCRGAAGGRRLNITVCNRSNDLVWGMLGANVVHFSFLLEYMAARLGYVVGKYHHFTNNLHAYEWNWKPDIWLEDQTPDYYYPGRADPYLSTGRHAVSPADTFVPLVKDPAVFEYELPLFVEVNKGPQDKPYLLDILEGRYVDWQEPFLRSVATPMCNAWHCYKQGELDRAVRWADLVAADDWCIAAHDWMYQRFERRAIAKYGGG